MGEWKEYKLEDLCVFQRGHDLPRSQMMEGKYPVAGSNGVIGYHSKFTTKGPGVTIGRSGSIGVAYYYENDFWAHNTVLYVNEFHGSNPRFVYYFLKNLDFDQFNAGSAVPTLNRNHIHGLIVKFPEVPEQRAIASVLSSLDDKIDLLHRQNATLEKMAETLFRKWFVEEETPAGKVSDLVDILSGFAFKSSDFIKGEYRLVTIKNVQDGYLDLSKADCLGDLPSQMPEYCLLEVGDILLSLTGNVGRCCLVTDTKLLLNQRVAKLNPKSQRDRAFTYAFFRLPATRAMLEELAKGTAQANLSPVETKDLGMPCPSSAKLSLFGEKANPIIDKVLKNWLHIRTLTQVRDTLLPKLMSGEVRVEA